MPAIPSSEELIEEALRNNPNFNVNDLHSATFDLMMHYKAKYYESKVDGFLSRMTLSDISPEVKRRLRIELLQPIEANNVEYSNFMEEASRRISQAFQPISGNLAELCAQRELERVGLERNIHFTRRRERTDFIVYYPNFTHCERRHRIEVKNVKIRERAVRGLGFDGDSILGFFDDPNEFSRGNVELIDSLCQERNGYCYLPNSTLEQMTYHGNRFRPNTQFGSDMLAFVQNGRIP